MIVGGRMVLNPSPAERIDNFSYSGDQKDYTVQVRLKDGNVRRYAANENGEVFYRDSSGSSYFVGFIPNYDHCDPVAKTDGWVQFDAWVLSLYAGKRWVPGGVV